jgi:hypothetical protein
MFEVCGGHYFRKGKVMKTEKKEKSGSGACTKCGCKSWRGDSGEPEKCINIKVPTQELCGHTKEEHS